MKKPERPSYTDVEDTRFQESAQTTFCFVKQVQIIITGIKIKRNGLPVFGNTGCCLSSFNLCDEIA
jgi:hypothetical protein